MASKKSVIGYSFCRSYPLELVIKRNHEAFPGGNFSITDADGNLLFTTRHSFSFFGSARIVLYDRAGAPVVTLKNKRATWHDRWQVFRGDETEPGFLVFSVKRSSMFQRKTKLNVFLRNNNDEVNADFKVKETSREESCVILSGGSDQILAEMNREVKVQKPFSVYHKFMVRVNPNIDYVFIVVLIIILDTFTLQFGSTDYWVGPFGGKGAKYTLTTLKLITEIGQTFAGRMRIQN